MDSATQFRTDDRTNPVDDSILSLDELKAQLRQTLRDKGVESGLRADFRSQLIAKLKVNKRANVNDESTSSITASTPRDLRQRLQDSIVAEYLEASGFHYSLSVFLPESGAEQHLLSPRDVLFAMRMSPWAPPSPTNTRTTSTSTSTSTSENHNHTKKKTERAIITDPPVLTRIVGHISQSATALMSRTHCSTQTDDSTTTPGEQLERKLQAIHDDFSKACHEAAAPLPQTLEERMLQYQSDCDKRSQKTIENEIERIRTLEVGAIRAQERAHFNKQLTAATETLRQEYTRRVNNLRRREEEVDSKLAAKTMEIESRLHADRQDNLCALDELKRARDEVKRTAFALDRESHSRDEAFKQSQRALDRRESDLERRERTVSLEVDTRVRAAREEAEAALRTQRVAAKEESTRLEALALKLDSERNALDQLKERTNGIDKLLIESQESLNETREAERVARGENERLKSQLEVTMQLLQRGNDGASQLESKIRTLNEKLLKLEEAARVESEQHRITIAHLEQALTNRRGRSSPASPASRTTATQSRVGGLMSVDGVSMPVFAASSRGVGGGGGNGSPTGSGSGFFGAGAGVVDDDEELSTGDQPNERLLTCRKCESMEYRLRGEEIERSAAEEEVMKLKQLLREHRARLTLVQPFVLDPMASAVDLMATRALESTDPTIQLRGAVFPPYESLFGHVQSTAQGASMGSFGHVQSTSQPLGATMGTQHHSQVPETTNMASYQQQYAGLTPPTQLTSRNGAETVSMPPPAAPLISQSTYQKQMHAATDQDLVRDDVVELQQEQTGGLVAPQSSVVFAASVAVESNFGDVGVEDQIDGFMLIASDVVADLNENASKLISISPDKNDMDETNATDISEVAIVLTTSVSSAMTEVASGVITQQTTLVLPSSSTAQEQNSQISRVDVGVDVINDGDGDDDVDVVESGGEGTKRETLLDVATAIQHENKTVDEEQQQQQQQQQQQNEEDETYSDDLEEDDGEQSRTTICPSEQQGNVVNTTSVSKVDSIEQMVSPSLSHQTGVQHEIDTSNISAKFSASTSELHEQLRTISPASSPTSPLSSQVRLPTVQVDAGLVNDNADDDIDSLPGKMMSMQPTSMVAANETTADTITTTVHDEEDDNIVTGKRSEEETIPAAFDILVNDISEVETQTAPVVLGEGEANTEGLSANEQTDHEQHEDEGPVLSWIERQRAQDDELRRARLDRNRNKSIVTTTTISDTSLSSASRDSTNARAQNSEAEQQSEVATESVSVVSKGAAAADRSSEESGALSPKDKIMDQYLQNARRKVDEAKQQRVLEEQERQRKSVRDVVERGGNDDTSDGSTGNQSEANGSSEESFELSVGSMSNSGDSGGDDGSYF